MDINNMQQVIMGTVYAMQFGERNQHQHVGACVMMIVSTLGVMA